VLQRCSTLQSDTRFSTLQPDTRFITLQLPQQTLLAAAAAVWCAHALVAVA
jgi:50S ribosomal subunit-associated GTPase HflX